MTYRIVRFYEDGRRHVETTGFTLEQCQAHCNLESTHGKTRRGIRWFDGYEPEKEKSK